MVSHSLTAFDVVIGMKQYLHGESLRMLQVQFRPLGPQDVGSAQRINGFQFGLTRIKSA